MRAALYTRISRDDAEQRLGVQRQAADLKREAGRRQARIVAVLEDNDLSGSGKVERPQFERLIQMIDAGELDLVLAADLDRLSRGFRPYVRFYEACERSRITVAWLGGEANFATGAGLLELDVRASFAREELRKIKSRTARKHLELAETGKDVGGGRPFGYEPDRVTIRQSEAKLIRQAATKLLQGASLRGIARQWTEAGVETVSGKQTWNTSVVRKILISARISGRRERCTIDGKRRDVGIITADAEWPAIIDHETSDAVRSLLSDGTRRLNGHPTKYLLAGIATCKLCGTHLIARPRSDGVRSLVCPGDRGGCGRLRVVNDALEALIGEMVLQAIDKGALAKALRGTEDKEAQRDLVSTDRKLNELVADYASDRITRGQFDRAQTILKAKLADLQKRVAASRGRLGLSDLDDQLRMRWPKLELHRKRAVIALLIDKVEVGPATRGRSRFDSTRIDVWWRV
jgi:DNA invertase Pin-like site-specific DNA recombinase